MSKMKRLIIHVDEDVSCVVAGECIAHLLEVGRLPAEAEIHSFGTNYPKGLLVDARFTKKGTNVIRVSAGGEDMDALEPGTRR